DSSTISLILLAEFPFLGTDKSSSVNFVTARSPKVSAFNDVSNKFLDCSGVNFLRYTLKPAISFESISFLGKSQFNTTEDFILFSITISAFFIKAFPMTDGDGTFKLLP